MNSRDLVRKFFRRQTVERVPLLPLAYYQASRIDGAPAEELIGEPPRLARAVLGLSKLLLADCVTVRLDSAVLTAFGFDLSWPVVDGPPVAAGEGVIADSAMLAGLAEPLLSTITAVKAELRGEKPVLAVVPGPVALSDRLGGADETAVAALIRGLADAVCKGGAEILVIEDDATDEARLKRLAGPIVNTARYYSASVVLSLGQPVKERLADALLLPAGMAAGAPGPMLPGILLSGGALADGDARAAIAARVAETKPFVSLDDASMVGREVSAILSGLGAVLGRG
jgi:hypothetical protein